MVGGNLRAAGCQHHRASTAVIADELAMQRTSWMAIRTMAERDSDGKYDRSLAAQRALAALPLTFI